MAYNKLCLTFFSEENTKAISRYKKYISESLSDTINNKINFNTANQKSFPAICDDIFMKKLELIQNKKQAKFELTLEKIIQFVCMFYQIEESQLHKKSRGHFNAKVRAMIAWTAMEFNITTLTQVATYFNRETSSISRVLNRIFFLANEEFTKIKEFIQKNATTQA